MKIVILGAGGQVGRELARVLQALGEVLAWDRSQADLERPDELVARLAAERPAAIVNAAAYTAVDRAESEPERAELINATAVGRIAAEARRLDAVLVHYSTDYVLTARSPAAAARPTSLRRCRSTGRPSSPASGPSRLPVAGPTSFGRAGSTRPMATTSCGRCCGWRASERS
jgi:nucleoside-diphosphate-sugar epimerase